MADDEGDAVEVMRLVWAACDNVNTGMSARSTVHDSLFEAGMDSLALAELVIQLEEAVGACTQNMNCCFV